MTTETTIILTPAEAERAVAEALGATYNNVPEDEVFDEAHWIDLSGATIGYGNSEEGAWNNIHCWLMRSPDDYAPLGRAVALIYNMPEGWSAAPFVSGAISGEASNLELFKGGIVQRNDWMWPMRTPQELAIACISAYLTSLRSDGAKIEIGGP